MTGRDKLITVLEKEYNGTLTAAGESSGRERFIYTHFIMPHYPYLFDRNGNQLSFEESQRGEGKICTWNIFNTAINNAWRWLIVFLKKIKQGQLLY